MEEEKTFGLFVKAVIKRLHEEVPFFNGKISVFFRSEDNAPGEGDFFVGEDSLYDLISALQLRASDDEKHGTKEKL